MKKIEVYVRIILSVACFVFAGITAFVGQRIVAPYVAVQTGFNNDVSQVIFPGLAQLVPFLIILFCIAIAGVLSVPVAKHFGKLAGQKIINDMKEETDGLSR